MPQDRSVPDEQPSAGAQCSAWLADNRKKALLADVGVGTVDQSLLGVLQVRHQSLRLLGLGSKVLVVDEVHAYDEYMSRLLETLVEAQAIEGGSVVLLSATVPASLRCRLVAAFARGRGLPAPVVEPDMRYPLATYVSDGARMATACKTRPELERRVAGVLAAAKRDTKDGKSLVWKVGDLRANPTVSRKNNTGEKAKRHDVLMDAKKQCSGKTERRSAMDAAALAWLVKRAPQWGLAVREETVMMNGYRQHSLPGKCTRVGFSTLDYSGLAAVMDPELLLSALTGGVGHERSYGCGLLLVRRAE